MYTDPDQVQDPDQGQDPNPEQGQDPNPDHFLLILKISKGDFRLYCNTLYLRDPDSRSGSAQFKESQPGFTTLYYFRDVRRAYMRQWYSFQCACVICTKEVREGRVPIYKLSCPPC